MSAASSAKVSTLSIRSSSLFVVLLNGLLFFSERFEFFNHLVVAFKNYVSVVFHLSSTICSTRGKSIFSSYSLSVSTSVVLVMSLSSAIMISSITEFPNAVKRLAGRQLRLA